MSLIASLALVCLSPFLAVQEEEVGRALDFQTGSVEVGTNLATMSVPEGWAYLQSADARFVVEEIWGNPEDPSVIGFVAPPDAEESGWGIVVSYEEEGHVDDADAASLDYSDLLSDMKKSTRETNNALKAQGYETVELLGWAEPPHYDSAGKKLYWAKRLQFSSLETETLNYDVRILGREGVLVLTAVAEVEELAKVASGCKAVLAGTEFVEGKRYADFNPKTDKLAAYGVGGLIAGKLLLKGGFLAKLGLLFAKGWKLILVGVAVVVGAVKKMTGSSRRAA